MNPDGPANRTIALAPDARAVLVLDQTLLPFRTAWRRLEALDDAVAAIRTMVVRGAPLIGVTAAYGLWLALRADPSDGGLRRASAALVAARPTAVNLAWAVARVAAEVAAVAPEGRAAAALASAERLAEEDVATNLAIGRHGVGAIEAVASRLRGARPVRVLTHCNAGWLATVAGGTALAPVYEAQRRGVAVEVVADETRPRNQGASLTAYELREAGVPCVVVADNASGHLLQRREVDLVIVGADRVAANGDVANKIGTYSVAVLAARHKIPFYVAAPTSSIDLACKSGDKIPIEERSPDEVSHVNGRMLTPRGVKIANPAFDVTPHELVTAIITENGVARPPYGKSLARLVRGAASAPGQRGVSSR